METFLLIIRLLLAVVFALAGIGKLLDLKGSKKALRDFGAPAVLIGTLAVLLPAAELFAAGLLLFAETSWFGALAGSVLLLIFIAGMSWQIYRGQTPDCHCFGQIHSEPVSPKSLVRNGIFAAAALFLVFRGRDAQGAELFSAGLDPANQRLETIIGLALLALLGAAVYLLKQISDQQTRILRRLEVVEMLAQEGGAEVTRGDIAHPHDGLPVGAPAPDFSVPDVRGQKTTLDHLLSDGKPALLFFVSPTCSPCAALLPEIQRWKNRLGGRFNFIFFSTGKPDENSSKFGDAAVNILLDKDRRTALKYGAVWTPSAVLVNTDGSIGSRIAAGDGAIRELLDRIKTERPGKAALYLTDERDETRKSRIGDPVPEFSMADLRGRTIGADDFRGQKTLAAFWSTTCPHCVKMIGELRDWEKQKGSDEPALVIFSDGEAEDYRDLELHAPVLLDHGYEISKKLGMFGTPSAVLIDENGEIASETAIGSMQIWALLGKYGENGKTD